jgi:hypothetical protein
MNDAALPGGRRLAVSTPKPLHNLRQCSKCRRKNPERLNLSLQAKYALPALKAAMYLFSVRVKARQFG